MQALKVQMKMLPENDQVIEGIYFEHLIKPSLYLSGDFLDYFKLDNDRVLFYFADVSGHGASSAFVTVLLKISQTVYLQPATGFKRGYFVSAALSGASQSRTAGNQTWKARDHVCGHLEPKLER